MFANSAPDAVSGAATTMPKSLEEGDSFVVSVAVNFRDGAKGFDLRNSANATIVNFNVGSDQYNITGTSGLYGNAYDSNTVITFTFTQNATDVSWTAVRSGGSSGSESGTIGSISPGTIENVRFYNVSAGFVGGSERDFFINSLEFNSLYTITNSSTVSSVGDITVPYLDIQSGSTLNIPSNSSVTVSGNLNNSGTLNLTSTSTAYSSVIPTSASGLGTTTYSRFVNSNTNGNDLISSPVSGQTWASFLDPINSTALLNDGGAPTTIYAFAPFDKVTGAYENYDSDTSATLSSGTGYRAATDDILGLNLTFTGNTIATGTVSVDIENSGPEFELWNLVGNPYPSYLNVHAFLNHEVSTGVSNLDLFAGGTEAIYGYDGDASNGWTIYNLATTTVSTVIAPGQGFFVSADATNAPLYNLEYTSGMRSAGSTDDFIASRNAELVYVKLRASTNSNSYGTDIYFNANASLGFDLGYDAAIWGDTTPSFSLYSHLVEDNIGGAMAIQAVNSTDVSDVSIPLGVNANQGEQLTFSILDATLPASVNVYLEDTVANTTTLLNNGDYVITPTTDLSGTGRFFLRTSEDALSTIENSLDTLNVFAQHATKELVVSGQLQENTVLDLYDIQGKKVFTTQLDNTLIQNRINVSNLYTGVYVVTVRNNNQEFTKKLIIK